MDSIFIGYKEEQFRSKTTKWLFDANDNETDSYTNEEEEENFECDITAYFDLDLYETLKTPIERLRYFVLYQLHKI